MIAPARLVTCLLAVLGCGRVGFDPASLGAVDAAGPDAAEPDAAAVAGCPIATPGAVVTISGVTLAYTSFDNMRMRVESVIVRAIDGDGMIQEVTSDVT